MKDLDIIMTEFVSKWASIRKRENNLIRKIELAEIERKVSQIKEKAAQIASDTAALKKLVEETLNRIRAAEEKYH